MSVKRTSVKSNLWEEYYMKFLKENVGSIAICLFELIVGVLLLINPIGFTTWIIRIAGVVLMLLGLMEAVRYFMTSAEEAAFGQNLAKGLISFLAGGFCVFKTEWFIATFPVFTIIYGVMILIAGIGKVQLTVDMLRRKIKKWFWAAISAVISIVCAIVILGNPFTSTTVLWMFTGATLIVEAALDIVTMIIGRKSSEEDSI